MELAHMEVSIRKRPREKNIRSAFAERKEMAHVERLLFCFLLVCGVMAIQCRHPPEPVLAPNFLASLTSRVRETEPKEIREFRMSCQKEPGCSWRCPGDGYESCKCNCGSSVQNNSRA